MKRFPITRKQFVEWLRQKTQGARLGRYATSIDCALSHAVRDVTGLPYVSAGYETLAVGEHSNNKKVYNPVPLWAKEVIRIHDAVGYRKRAGLRTVTAKQFREEAAKRAFPL